MDQHSMSFQYPSLVMMAYGSGNLTPPESVYNTTLTAQVITLSGLPLGVLAILINLVLIVSIIRNGTFTPATYILYFHIALCDMLNGAIGIVTSAFMLQNMRKPIQPEVADAFCHYFAAIPTCLIRLLLYLMTTMAIFRAYIAFRPDARVSKLGVNFFTSFSYLAAIGLVFWFKQTSVQVIALPDGWCAYFTPIFSLNDILYAAIIDSGPAIICSLIIIISLSLVTCRLKAAANHHVPDSHVTDGRGIHGDSENTQPLLVHSYANTQVRTARNIITHIILTFLVCYSAALYIEFRQIIMAFGGARYDFVTFPDEDGPPNFATHRLIVFRLKFTLTIIFSIINPILVFRGSYIFRTSIGNVFNDDFSYVIS